MIAPRLNNHLCEVFILVGKIGHLHVGVAGCALCFQIPGCGCGLGLMVNPPSFSAEVKWFHLDQKMSGTATLSPAAPKPTAVYEFKDQDTVSLAVRVQRNF